MKRLKTNIWDFDKAKKGTDNQCLCPANYDPVVGELIRLIKYDFEKSRPCLEHLDVWLTKVEALNPDWFMLYFELKKR